MILKILVIEDQLDLLDNIREILEFNELEVLTANNGIEGLQLAREVIPDLIISDVMMPQMDGFEMLENLRKDSGSLAMIPFIFLTAKTQLDDRLRGAASGANCYLLKPFQSEELMQAVKACLVLKWKS